MKSFWTNLVGIYSLSLQFGKQGLKLISDGTSFMFRNAADSADVPVRVSRLDVSGDDIVLGSEEDEKLTVSRDPTQADALQIILPNEKGNDGDLLRVRAGDGPGIMVIETVPPSGSASNVVADTTNFAFGSSGTIVMFDLPEGALYDRSVVHLDEPFDGAPSISIGIAGDLSKYVPATAIDLTYFEPTRFEHHPNELPPSGGPESLIATYSAGGATEGSGRIVVYYTPAPV